MWQSIVVFILIILAVGYLAKRLYMSVVQPTHDGCAKRCNACSVQQPNSKKETKYT
jgi:hypothetical protein